MYKHSMTLKKKSTSSLFEHSKNVILIVSRVEWNAAHAAANGALSSILEGNLDVMGMALNQAHICVKLSYTRLQNTEALATHVQGQLALESGWQVGDDEYNCFKEDVILAKYQQALGDLEQLVIMCLFELTKYGISGTGKLFLGRGPGTQLWNVDCKLCQQIVMILFLGAALSLISSFHANSLILGFLSYSYHHYLLILGPLTFTVHTL